MAQWRRLGILIVFGVAFGYVEAAVVFYLRHLVAFRFNTSLHHYRTIVNLGFIAFVHPAHQYLLSTRIADAEVVRESATIVMLVALAVLVARRRTAMLGAFMVGFATWDLTYYLWLRVLIHWPTSLLTRDVFFLIPVTWIGPVITPVVISTVMLIIGARLFLRDER